MTRPAGPVIVTGANGFIGRRLCAALAARGVRATGWTRAVADLQDGDAVAARMRAEPPSVVFHLASAGVDAARAHDGTLIGQEVAMTAALVAAMPAGSRLVVAGSMSEYGEAGILRETDRPAPKTAYGIAKLASGQYAAAYGTERGIDVRIARLFGVYGPGEGPRRLFPALVEALADGREMPLSDGLQRRDFIHVDDAAAALILLGEIPRSPDAGLVNIGTGIAVPVGDAARWIAEASGAPPELLRFGARPRSPGDADLLCADVERQRRLLGSVPPQRLAPGLTLALFREGAPLAREPVEGL